MQEQNALHQSSNIIAKSSKQKKATVVTNLVFFHLVSFDFFFRNLILLNMMYIVIVTFWFNVCFISRLTKSRKYKRLGSIKILFWVI